MKKIIFIALQWLFTVPFVLIALCFYPLYALFRGMTDKFVFDNFFDILESILHVVNYPIERWEDKKNKYKEVSERLVYFRKRCKKMDAIITEMKEKENKQ